MIRKKKMEHAIVAVAAEAEKKKPGELRALNQQLEAKKQELDEERITLGNIIELNPYSVQICDADGHHIRANQAFLALFHCTPPPEWSIFTDPILKEAGRQELICKVKSGEVVRTPETWYNPHDLKPELPDKHGCISSVIFPILNLHGQIEKIIIMHEDVTERKKAEQELKKKLHELERFHRVTVGRELRMIELKKEIATLRTQSKTESTE